MKISCIFIWVFILTHALVLAAKSTNPTNNLKSKIKTPNPGQQKSKMQEPPPPPPIWNNVPKSETPVEKQPEAEAKEIAVPVELTPENWYELVVDKKTMTIKDE